MRAEMMMRFARLRSESGFTLVELLFTTALAAILFTVGALALRTYWMRRGLDSSAKSVTAQLRQLQQRAVAESHPLIYGARFTEGSTTYTTFKYNPADSVSPCTKVNTLSFEAHVEAAVGTSFTASPYIDLTKCEASGGTDHFVFFFARGTATDGTLTLTQDSLADSKSISVTNLTGRVEGGF
jgi:prepilin-type N-terminal cleavage/methylation domain-containing protein